MNKLTVLSASNKTDAKVNFLRKLSERYILLVVCGTGPAATQALGKIQQNMANSPFYTPVWCVHVPKPEFIVDEIRRLRHRSSVVIDWNAFGKYLVLSISNCHNNIGAILTESEYKQYPQTIIDDIVISAIAVDEPM